MQQGGAESHVHNRPLLLVGAVNLAHVPKEIFRERLLQDSIDVERLPPAKGVNEHLACCCRVEIPSAKELHKNDADASISLGVLRVNGHTPDGDRSSFGVSLFRKRLRKDLRKFRLRSVSVEK